MLALLAARAYRCAGGSRGSRSSAPSAGRSRTSCRTGPVRQPERCLVTALFAEPAPGDLVALDVRRSEDSVRVAATGEIDSTSAPLLRELLEACSTSPGSPRSPSTSAASPSSTRPGCACWPRPTAAPGRQDVRMRVLASSRAVVRPLQITGLWDLLRAEQVNADAGRSPDPLLLAAPRPGGAAARHVRRGGDSSHAGTRDAVLVTSPGRTTVRDAVICEPLRTPVGGFGGSLRDVPAAGARRHGDPGADGAHRPAAGVRRRRPARPLLPDDGGAGDRPGRRARRRPAGDRARACRSTGAAARACRRCSTPRCRCSPAPPTSSSPAARSR